MGVTSLFIPGTQSRDVILIRYRVLLGWNSLFKLFDVLAGVKDLEELKHFQVVPVLDHTTATFAAAAATKEKF